MLIAGMNVGARDVQIHLHGKEPAIRMLVMTPLDGEVAFADSIVVSPELAGEVHGSRGENGRSVDVSIGDGYGVHARYDAANGGEIPFGIVRIAGVYFDPAVVKCILTRCATVLAPIFSITLAR